MYNYPGRGLNLNLCPIAIVLSPLLALLVTYLVVHPPLVTAQGTNATCRPGFEWMDNSRGQSPCLVSSWLLAPCSLPDKSWVYPLQPGFHYNTPLDSPLSATPCRCNTVLFSTIAACATCQGQEAWIVPWSTYSQNCTNVDIQKYPKSIPPEIAVPAWAYLDITTKKTFDPVAAQAVEEENIPDSTGIPQPTATGSSSSTHSNSKNVGAIVGGVVGGVVGVIAVGVAVFFFFRYRRNKLKSTSQSAGVYSQQTHAEMSTAQSNVQSLASHDSPKLYNPEDPSTFPNAENLSTRYETSFPPYPSVNYQNSTYTGAPEIEI